MTEHEELLKLRALVEKQAAELAAKNRLFADTPKGATANAVLYTLVESARINELDVFAYLKYLLTEMPNNQHLEHPEIIDNYLPWSTSLPEECRLNYKNKKCLKK